MKRLGQCPFCRKGDKNVPKAKRFLYYVIPHVYEPVITTHNRVSRNAKTLIGEKITWGGAPHTTKLELIYFYCAYKASFSHERGQLLHLSRASLFLQKNQRFQLFILASKENGHTNLQICHTCLLICKNQLRLFGVPRNILKGSTTLVRKTIHFSCCKPTFTDENVSQGGAIHKQQVVKRC